ncbi:MAG: hypothetical protein KDK39_14165 [Leptospiraceae bacterium]|nr:hypothetical protein [Leptospiraceae bacterium]
MQLKDLEFKQQLTRFIEFRGIDIMLYLKNGTVLELDKNRQLEGDMVVQRNRDGSENAVHLDDIVKADFFAA